MATDYKVGDDIFEYENPDGYAGENIVFRVMIRRKSKDDEIPAPWLELREANGKTPIVRKSGELAKEYAIDWLNKNGATLPMPKKKLKKK